MRSLSLSRRHESSSLSKDEICMHVNVNENSLKSFNLRLMVLDLYVFSEKCGILQCIFHLNHFVNLNLI